MVSKFEQTGAYQDLLSVKMWTERRLAFIKRQAKPDAQRLKELKLEQEAVTIALRALNQHGT